NVKHPVICSESGRAILSHHSILIFEAIGASTNTAPSLSSIGLQYSNEFKRVGSEEGFCSEVSAI
ncbi:hypothetical protein RYX36_014031, partial [Vicia faba]